MEETAKRISRATQLQDITEYCTALAKPQAKTSIVSFEPTYMQLRKYMADIDVDGYLSKEDCCKVWMLQFNLWPCQRYVLQYFPSSSGILASHHLFGVVASLPHDWIAG
jgi:hypothetical protein